jgi:hypothetical protein
MLPPGIGSVAVFSVRPTTVCFKFRSGPRAHHPVLGLDGLAKVRLRKRYRTWAQTAIGEAWCSNSDFTKPRPQTHDLTTCSFGGHSLSRYVEARPPMGISRRKMPVLLTIPDPLPQVSPLEKLRLISDQCSAQICRAIFSLILATCLSPLSLDLQT